MAWSLEPKPMMGTIISGSNHYKNFNLCRMELDRDISTSIRYDWDRDKVRTSDVTLTCTSCEFVES